MGRVEQNGGWVEETSARRHHTAAQQLGPPIDGVGQLPVDLPPVLLGDHRAHVDPFVHRLADDQFVDLDQHALEKLGGHTLLDVDPLDRAAVLPAVGQRAPDDPARRALDVGVSGDDGGVLAAQREHDGSRRAPGGSHHALTGDESSGDEYLVDLGMGYETQGVLGERGNDVDDAGRKAGLLAQLTHP